MKVLIYPQDKGGCGMYRMYWPAEALKNAGHDVGIMNPRMQLIQDDKRVIGLVQKVEADVVVFQRPARPAYVDLIDVFHAQGTKVVIDMDDDLTTIHPLNPAFTPYQQQDMHWQFALQTCEKADLVTCTTQALADKYGNGANTVVIPNFIPERYLEVGGGNVDNYVTVGWAGLVMTHPTDLDVTHGAVNAALVEANKAGSRARFMAFGDDKALYKLGIRERAPHFSVPGTDIMLYPTILGGMDVGIVPLADSEFNRAKSWLKGLEYAACGVAPIVSPTPDNQRLIDAGAALSAANPREWKEAVQFLIQDDQEREALTTRAREFARTMTIERNCDQWWSEWSKL